MADVPRWHRYGPDDPNEMYFQLHVQGAGGDHVHLRDTIGEIFADIVGFRADVLESGYCSSPGNPNLLLRPSPDGSLSWFHVWIAPAYVVSMVHINDAPAGYMAHGACGAKGGPVVPSMLVPEILAYELARPYKRQPSQLCPDCLAAFPRLIIDVEQIARTE